MFDKIQVLRTLARDEQDDEMKPPDSVVED